MEILVIGLGYVGLVTAACLAEMGYKVICLDIDEKKIANLKKGIIPIFEPGLNDLIQRNFQAGRLLFTTHYTSLHHVQICFIAVATPASEDGSANLSYVQHAVESLADHMSHYLVIATKSTVPLGTAQLIKTWIANRLQKRGLDIPFDIVSNPEFLKEGSAVQDCMKPDRIIIGSDSKKAQELMRELYAPFTRNHDRMIFMDIPSAEITKYASNAMLATRISFMNEIAKLCEKSGANINKVRIGMGSDKRIGFDFLYAGIGYGGSCFPKDIKALIATAKREGIATPLLSAVEEINIAQKQRFFKKIEHYFPSLEGKTFGLWGLSFKPNTDDIREAPSLYLIEALLQKGADLRVFDPVAMENAKQLYGNHPRVTFCENEFKTAQSADAIVLITEWPQFRLINLTEILALMKGKAFFDARNQYQPETMQHVGFDYFCVGIRSQDPLVELLQLQELS